ncbi:hypothetical protein COCCU_01850 [Corynebacterium occultum]|uniref:DUF2516 domain-containing protein n=1 Tax=Corynebacterium occultum TaxID=2675219 RepID=A0A6B8VTE8_9CORY|nr:DUF2516 family protein [Corynebacterium occultum]QGU06329.1 hypothetical protein COCCU_01850 [Corynebacterium occultum]
MLADYILFAASLLERIIYIAIALSGLVGAALAASTREDAFTAGDRHSKWIWTAILLGSAVVVYFRFPFLSWAGMVAIGIYWFDVRPHLRSILSGNSGW